MNRSIVLGITGASGAIYGVRLLQVLVHAGCDVHVSVSDAGADVLKTELGLDVDLDRLDAETLLSGHHQNDRQDNVAPAMNNSPFASEKTAGSVLYHHYRDFYAPIASGSFLTAGMVICPCSGGTVSAVAHGTSANLIHRAADVHLKERRKLILVPRETPLSAIQLSNMTRCAEAGAVVLPAMPGFYHGVSTVSDLVDFVVARICDQLEIEHDLLPRWGSTRVDEESPRAHGRKEG